MQDSNVLPVLLRDEKRLFWLDLESPTAEEFKLLSVVFQFHPIAVEDAMRPHQRPKVDEYDGYFFLVADEVTLHLDTLGAGPAPKDSDAEDVRSRQVSMFLGTNYLVTIHVDPVEAVRILRE